jgi:hypothetical protein
VGNLPLLDASLLRDLFTLVAVPADVENVVMDFDPLCRNRS